MVKEAASETGFNFELYSKMIRPYSDPVASTLLLVFDSLTEFDEDEAREEAKEMATEHFQQKFAERMLVYPFCSMISLLLVGLVDVFQCGALTNQIYGLVVDFLGAIILGRGLLMGGVAIGAVSGTRWGYNPLLIKSMAKDSVDGVLGITIILIGILLQIIALGKIYPDLPIWAGAIC
ncbi:hypothetical protein EXE41_17110 [Halorubrum sp. SD690R]|uniref:hypothetical protein n=1 Tax=Halorubrum sp. SD690R TaxID=2518117 RepID=UPI0010FA3BCB|nr:hypothetical protein [Halorubrum sp. SD690R]TKX42467.1 hypothetical protein EXE41_17110 [Halorubrum sp. SD690R]